MRKTFLGAGVLVATSAILLGASGMASAEEGDFSTCGSDCEVNSYDVSGSNEYEAEDRVLGSQVATCPGASESRAEATESYEISSTSSINLSAGVGAGGTLAEAVDLHAGVEYSSSTTETYSTETGASFAVAAGNVGYVVFVAHMVHTEGTLNWTEFYFDEFNSSNDFTQGGVSYDTPMNLANGTPGTYTVRQSPMSEADLARLC